VLGTIPGLGIILVRPLKKPRKLSFRSNGRVFRNFQLGFPLFPRKTSPSRPELFLTLGNGSEQFKPKKSLFKFQKKFSSSKHHIQHITMGVYSFQVVTFPTLQMLMLRMRDGTDIIINVNVTDIKH
jgi:hypothetical protein